MLKSIYNFFFKEDQNNKVKKEIDTIKYFKEKYSNTLTFIERGDFYKVSINKNGITKYICVKFNGLFSHKNGDDGVVGLTTKDNELFTDYFLYKDTIIKALKMLEERGALV